MIDLDRLREMNVNTEDYRNAPSNTGPLAAEWLDKPHRLVYDLAFMVRHLTDALHDVLECQSVHDIIAQTGLPEARAKEIDAIEKIFSAR